MSEDNNMKWFIIGLVIVAMIMILAPLFAIVYKPQPYTPATDIIVDSPEKFQEMNTP